MFPKEISLSKMDPVKVVVQYSDGRTLKGYTQNFAPNKPIFHIRPNIVEVPDRTKEVSIKDLKGVFFVRDFRAEPNYKERKLSPYEMNKIGKKMEVGFKDGEVLVGINLGYDPRRPGFFIYPSDPNLNLISAFVVSEATEWVRYI